jgi:hypothetical protein
MRRSRSSGDEQTVFGTGGLVLKTGQVLYDNDPRYRGRKVEFIRVEGSYAICNSGPLQVKVRLDRIFFDDQPRRSGYTTVARIALISAGTQLAT